MASQSASEARRLRRELFDLLERLHRHKDAAYRDAWRKRGEIIAIFANMARKYDRLVVAFDEEQPAATDPLGDTAADLLVYTGKYLTWIAEQHPNAIREAGLPLDPAQVSATRGADALAAVFDAIADGSAVAESTSARAAWSAVRAPFEALELALMAQSRADACSEQILPYFSKAQLAWQLAVALSELVVSLEREMPDTMDKLRSQIAEMDKVARA